MKSFVSGKNRLRCARFSILGHFGERVGGGDGSDRELGLVCHCAFSMYDAWKFSGGEFLVLILFCLSYRWKDSCERKTSGDQFSRD